MKVWPRWLRIRYLVLIVLIVVTLMILNNNFSLVPLSQKKFKKELDHAIFSSKHWLNQRYDQILKKPNLFLLHMINDMAKMSQEPMFYQMIHRYLAVPRQSIWQRLVDEKVAVVSPPQAEWNRLDDYQRWSLYALAPDQVSLTNQELKSMFAKDEHHWGSLTHQLISLYVYQKYQGKNLDKLINHLCERIAFEALWDFRVTDLYIQRVAILLAAGRPDLVQARWVERIIAKQRANGGWPTDWYGWGPDLFSFRFKKQGSHQHPSVQAMWALYMIQYRYPEWLGRNY